MKTEEEIQMRIGECHACAGLTKNYDFMRDLAREVKILEWVLGISLIGSLLLSFQYSYFWFIFIILLASTIYFVLKNKKNARVSEQERN